MADNRDIAAPVAKVAVVLPACGVGKRAGASIPKQFADVRGQPLIFYAIDNFHRLAYVTHIVITVQNEWRPMLEQLIQHHQFSKVTLVPGNEQSRHLSILSGVEAAAANKGITDACSLVAIHDAVRPFLHQPTFQQVIGEASVHGAAAVTVPCVSTILTVRGTNSPAEGTSGCGGTATSSVCFLQNVLNRPACRQSEMPQVFDIGKLLAAYRRADEDLLLNGTCCLAVYQQAYREDSVSLVAGPPGLHWKVTYPSDFERAVRQLEAAASKDPIGESDP